MKSSNNDYTIHREIPRADRKASDLYAQFGFAPTAPASIGMAQWRKR
jgi:hypothetical protein